MKENKNYVSPEIEVIDVQAESIICSSTITTNDPFGGSSELTW